MFGLTRLGRHRGGKTKTKTKQKYFDRISRGGEAHYWGDGSSDRICGLSDPIIGFLIPC